jgi:hypothetical protein
MLSKKVYPLMSLAIAFLFLTPFAMTGVNALTIVEGASISSGSKTVLTDNFIEVTYSHSGTGTSQIMMYTPTGALASTFTCAHTGTRLDPYQTTTYRFYFEDWRNGDTSKSIGGIWKMSFVSYLSQYNCVDYSNVEFMILDISSKRAMTSPYNGFYFNNPSQWTSPYSESIYNKIPTTGADTAGLGQDITLEASQVYYKNGGATLGIEVLLSSYQEERNFLVKNSIQTLQFYAVKETAWHPSSVYQPSLAYGTAITNTAVNVPYNQPGCNQGNNMSYPGTQGPTDTSLFWSVAEPVFWLGVEAGFTAITGGGVIGLTGPSAAALLTEIGSNIYSDSTTQTVYQTTSSGYSGIQGIWNEQPTVARAHDWSSFQYLDFECANTLPHGTMLCFTIYGQGTYLIDGVTSMGYYTESLHLIIKI